MQNRNFDYQGHPGVYAGNATMTLAEFFGRIYSTMAMGVGLSAIISLMMVIYFPANVQAIFHNHVISIALFAVEFIVVIVLSSKTMKNSSASIPLFFLYSALNGLTLCGIFFAYAGGTIALSFVSATAMFLVMSLYGRHTKRNLSGLGKACIAGLFGMLILAVVSFVMSFFMSVTLFSLGISAVGILVFSGLIAWDNQKIEQYYISVDGQVTHGMAVQAALQLYLDFINLFLFIVRILGFFESK